MNGIKQRRRALYLVAPTCVGVLAVFIGCVELTAPGVDLDSPLREEVGVELSVTFTDIPADAEAFLRGRPMTLVIDKHYPGKQPTSTPAGTFQTDQQTVAIHTTLPSEWMATAYLVVDGVVDLPFLLTAGGETSDLLAARSGRLGIDLLLTSTASGLVVEFDGNVDIDEAMWAKVYSVKGSGFCNDDFPDPRAWDPFFTWRPTGYISCRVQTEKWSSWFPVAVDPDSSYTTFRFTPTTSYAGQPSTPLLTGAWVEVDTKKLEVGRYHLEYGWPVLGVRIREDGTLENTGSPNVCGSI